MGRSTTPIYVVHYRDQRGTHICVWNSKTSGRPNEKNLEKWRMAMNKSMQKDGVNYHVSLALGWIPHIWEASIINQKTYNRVCTVKMPMFEAI